MEKPQKACEICDVMFTPITGRYDTQHTCGHYRCVKERKQLTYNKRNLAKRKAAGYGSALTKKGKIKEFFLVRGTITAKSTGYSSFEGGSID